MWLYINTKKIKEKVNSTMHEIFIVEVHNI